MKMSLRKQNVREFHTMINNLAAKLLVAIQVQGYVIGLLLGHSCEPGGF